MLYMEFSFSSVLFFVFVFQVASEFNVFINDSTIPIKDNGEVIFVSIIYRHGDRTPVSTYPNDPYNNLSYWPTEWGQLTNLGKKQHYELGKWLANRYKQLISHRYDRNDVYVRSTDVDRTLMSALSNLAGLYPPNDKEIWNTDLRNWQPIPVHTIPENEDNVLAAKKKCPKYEHELEQVRNSPEFKKINEQNKILYQLLTKYTGAEINCLQNLEYLYNTLTIETLYNFTLPDWTRGIYPEKLKKWADFSFKEQCYNIQLQRLKTGLLLNEIVTNMLQKSDNKLDPDRKLWIYSAHDVTVANVLMSLNVFQVHSPPYTSCILIELRKDSHGKFGVMIYYRKNETDIELLKVPNCDYFCDLSSFKSILNPILLTQNEWENECKMNSLFNFSKQQENNLLLVSALVIGSLLMVFLFFSVVILLIRFKNRHTISNKFYSRLDGFEH